MKQKQDKHEQELSASASAQDCTGLIPTAPADGDAQEAYEALFPYLPTANGETDKGSSQKKDHP